MPSRTIANMSPAWCFFLRLLATAPSSALSPSYHLVAVTQNTVGFCWKAQSEEKSRSVHGNISQRTFCVAPQHPRLLRPLHFHFLRFSSSSSSHVFHCQSTRLPRQLLRAEKDKEWKNKGFQGGTGVTRISPGVLPNRALCLCPFCVFSFSELNSPFQKECSTKCALLVRCSVGA